MDSEQLIELMDRIEDRGIKSDPDPCIRISPADL